MSNFFGKSERFDSQVVFNVGVSQEIAFVMGDFKSENPAGTKLSLAVTVEHYRLIHEI